MMVDKKPVVFFVLGGPGSGKGTQCAKLVEDFGFAHLSAGDCLREEVNPYIWRMQPNQSFYQRDSGSETADIINKCIVEGKIVPVEITCQLLKKGMEKKGWNERKFLIDGFPRNQDNYDGWQKVMGETVDVPFILFLEADQDTMINRIVERSKTSGRNDDNIDTLKKRFSTYEKETMPIIEFYEKVGRVKRVNALQGIDEVYAEVKQVLADYI